jgi:hypothetical protein
MILGFVGIAAALYGGMVLAGIVTAWHWPFMWLILTGEPLTKPIVYGAATGAAIIMGFGYWAMSRGLSVAVGWL